MPDRPAQSFAHHVRFLPGFHFFVVPVLLINLIVAIVAAARAPSLGTAWAVVVALALWLGMILARSMTLTVQNRLIRLEETRRLERLLPDRRDAIAALSIRQLIAIRFAPDAEVPELVGRIAAGELREPKDIKRAVASWRADHTRA